MLRRSSIAGMVLVGVGFCASAQAPADARVDTVTIQVDLGKAVDAYKPLYSWFGYDESNYSTTPQGRELLGELHDLSAAPVYIRAHHLLMSGDGVPTLKWSSSNVYREDASGKPVYDFRVLDGIFGRVEWVLIAAITRG